MQWNINYHIFANFPPGLFFKKYFCLGIIKGKASLAVNIREVYFLKNIYPRGLKYLREGLFEKRGYLLAKIRCN